MTATIQLPSCSSRIDIEDFGRVLGGRATPCAVAWACILPFDCERVVRAEVDREIIQLAQ